MPPRKIKREGKKKVQRTITIETKKEIIKRYERGIRVTDLAIQYKMAKSTISTILKNKQAIKEANVAKGVTVLNKMRSQTLEEVEKILFMWINEKQMAGDRINELIICDKARQVYRSLLNESPSTSGTQEEFKASKGWFDNFRKRTGIHCVLRDVEAVSEAASSVFVAEFAEYVQAEGYLPQQVFNCDETGLFWKKMPSRTFITQEERKLPGHKPMKDRLTLLLCSNASGDMKLKPLLVYHSNNPRAFKQHNVNKARLPVMWRANIKACVTRNLFMEWLDEVFAPTVRQYLSENQLPQRCLLVMDNAPAHPPYLAHSIEHDFIQVKFLPPNTTPILQPMDQEIICTFKKLYTKALFTRCFHVTEDTSLTLEEFWKKHFNIFHCTTLIDNAWNEVTYHTLNSAWRKLWPECVADYDLKDFDPEVVQVIVSMGNNMGLEVNDQDVEELVAEHAQDLTADELVHLHREQQKELAQEQSADGEDGEEGTDASSDLIKSTMEKWSDVQGFLELYHPNKVVTNRIVNMVNDNLMNHFRIVMQERKRKMTSDTFALQIALKNSPRTDESPEPQLPDVETKVFEL